HQLGGGGVPQLGVVGEHQQLAAGERDRSGGGQRGDQDRRVGLDGRALHVGVRRGRLRRGRRLFRGGGKGGGAVTIGDGGEEQRLRHDGLRRRLLRRRLAGPRVRRGAFRFGARYDRGRRRCNRLGRRAGCHLRRGICGRREGDRAAALAVNDARRHALVARGTQRGE